MKKQDVTLGGIVTSVKSGNDRNGRPYGIAKLEDFEGSGELKLWGEDWARWGGYMTIGSYLFVRAKVMQKRFGNDLFLQINDIKYMSDIKSTAINDITIHLNLNNADASTITELSSILKEHKGDVPLYFSVSGMETTHPVLLRSGNLSVDVTGHFVDKLDMINGIKYTINER